MPCDVIFWAKWFESAPVEGRRVGFDRVNGVEVSTVFMGLDHKFIPGGDPHLFECMTFKGGEVVDCERCGTWAEAEAMHSRAVASHGVETDHPTVIGEVSQ